MSDDLEPTGISVIRFASRLLSNLLRQVVYFPHASYCPGQILARSIPHAARRRELPVHAAQLIRSSVGGNATVSELERWRNGAHLSL
jgi:hypothetical protein